jgi:hypothetical protein
MSLDLRKEMPLIEGLDGYGYAYILLRDGPKPLSWITIRVPNGWAGRDDLRMAIERQAWLMLTKSDAEETGAGKRILTLLSRRAKRKTSAKSVAGAEVM